MPQSISLTSAQSAPAVELDGEDKSWQDMANCLGVDPDLFFPERGASTREAKEVCKGCVVRDDCLEYALANGEKFGIWGWHERARASPDSPPARIGPCRSSSAGSYRNCLSSDAAVWAALQPRLNRRFNRQIELFPAIFMYRVQHFLRRETHKFSTSNFCDCSYAVVHLGRTNGLRVDEIH